MFQTTPETPSLCRHNGQTCGACCWGVGVDRSNLETQLERNHRSFHSLSHPGRFFRARLFWHEVRSFRGRNLLWAVMLKLPILSRRVKQRLSQHLVCAFVGFGSDKREQVGCMLHPSLRHGDDIRNKVAFTGLAGIECGDPHYVCNGCRQFDALSPQQQAIFDQAVSDMDWFDYTTNVRAFSCGIAGAATQTKSVHSAMTTSQPPEPAQPLATSAKSTLLPILPDHAGTPGNVSQSEMQ